MVTTNLADLLLRCHLCRLFFNFCDDIVCRPLDTAANLVRFRSARDGFETARSDFLGKYRCRRRAIAGIGVGRRSNLDKERVTL